MTPEEDGPWATDSLLPRLVGAQLLADPKGLCYGQMSPKVEFTAPQGQAPQAPHMPLHHRVQPHHRKRKLSPVLIHLEP